MWAHEDGQSKAGQAKSPDKGKRRSQSPDQGQARSQSPDRPRQGGFHFRKALEGKSRTSDLKNQILSRLQSTR